MGFAQRQARIASEYSTSDIIATDSDYIMSPGDTSVFVDPSSAFAEVTLPSVSEALGQMYSIMNTCDTGNVVRINAKGDSTGFVAPDDLPGGGTYIFYSNGVQWLMLFSNVDMPPV